jgi:hypothetical protein
MQMRGMTKVVDDEGTAGAICLGPAVHAGRKHEAVQDKLPTSVEQIAQTYLLLRPVEHIILFHSEPRQSASFRSQSVARMRGGFLLREQSVVGSLPFGARYDARRAITFVHGLLLKTLVWIHRAGHSRA